MWLHVGSLGLICQLTLSFWLHESVFLACLMYFVFSDQIKVDIYSCSIETYHIGLSLILGGIQ